MGISAELSANGNVTGASVGDGRSDAVLEPRLADQPPLADRHWRRSLAAAVAANGCYKDCLA